MATIKDIARLAGVSTATVSHVVNGTKKLSPGTTHRVLAAIDQAHYTPNHAAKSLRSGTSRVIGILVEDIRGLPVPGIVSGISEELIRHAYTTLLLDLHLLDDLYNHYEDIRNYRESIAKAVFLLLSSNVEGIIYVGMHDRFLDHLIDPIPCPVVYAYSRSSDQDSFVTYNNESSAREMTNLLISRGHTHISIIAGHPSSSPTQERLHGFLSAMHQAGLQVPEEYIRYGNWGADSGRQEAEYLLSLECRPTAIFAMNDSMALGVLQALSRAGLSVPRQIAVCGFDNLDLTDAVIPPLTTIELPLSQIGTRSAQLLLQKIADPDTAPVQETLPCKLILRESV